MKHKHNSRVLGRTAAARRQLLKQLAVELIRRRTLVTTAAKAKEVRGWIEPLITKAKGEIGSSRQRHLRRWLPTDQDLKRLQELAVMHFNRPGGYTRITKLTRRLSDGAPLVRLDVVEPAAPE